MSRLLFELHFILLYSKDVASNLIWWEDFKVGEADPQAFHIDPATAQKTVFGGLIASGWHTCAVGMRMLCETLVKHRWEAVNQHGELVLTMEGWGFFGRKP